MSRKAFLIKVEVDIHAITCPGVWLCTNGKVSLQLEMLDSLIQTATYKPYFPIKCKEKFIFYKTFFSRHSLNNLQKELNREWIFLELIQWKNCEEGDVLASFQTTLEDLLYPSNQGGTESGIDFDLLMDITANFPGKIAPKIEISTKTTIEETLCTCGIDNSKTIVISPNKILKSTPHGPVNKRKIKTIVCQSQNYSSKKRANCKQVKSRPPFCYRKPEDYLILRKPQSHYLINPQTHKLRHSKGIQQSQQQQKQQQQYSPRHYCLSEEKPRKINHQLKKTQTILCLCGSNHKDNLCPVCKTYNGYFIKSAPASPKLQQNESRSNLYKNFCENNINQCCQCKINKEAKILLNCNCNAIKKQSLAEKIHEKLIKTLNTIPKAIESLQNISCLDDYSSNTMCERCVFYINNIKNNVQDSDTIERKNKIESNIDNGSKCSTPNCQLYKCICTN